MKRQLPQMSGEQRTVELCRRGQQSVRAVYTADHRVRYGYDGRGRPSRFWFGRRERAPAKVAAHFDPSFNESRLLGFDSLFIEQFPRVTKTYLRPC